MPTLDIGGQKVSVGEEFLSLPPDQQQATVDEIAASLPKKAEPVGVNDVVRSAASGVPIIGGLLNKANAATNAALAPAIEPFLTKGPDTLDQPTFGERYQKSLDIQNRGDKKFAEEHPIVDTTAKIAGGVGSLTGAALRIPGAAYSLGMTGGLPGMIARGAVSGGALGGADAAIRGEDVDSGAKWGAGFGMLGPVAGRAVGAAYNKVSGAVHPTPVAPQRVVDVNGTPVPVSESALTRDPAAAAREQIMLRGGAGEPAQAVATGARTETQAALKAAEDNFAAGLDPAARAPKITPGTAGQTVATDLVTQEQQRAAAEVARIQAAANERVGLRTSMDPPGATAPAPDTPFGMGEAVSAGVQRRAQEAAAARTAAYQRVGEMPGEFEPAVFIRAGTAIRDRLAGGASPVRITERVTPNAADALTVIDDQLGHLRFENQVRRGEAIIGPDGRPAARPITPEDVESVRKQLIPLQRAANQAARGPGGSAEDARAVRRVIEEFDGQVRRGVEAGGFSGDGPAYLQAQERARALHSEYRRNFSAQGPGDTVGRTIEDIIGRYPGQQITPDKIVQHILGNAAEPGGGNTVQIAQRLRGLLGADSPEWASIRKAAVAHMTEAPAGLEAVPHAVQADRIHNLLNGTKGRLLAQTLFTPTERNALTAYANRVRTVADPAPANSVERLIARLSGRDGSPPASTTEVVNQLFDLKANKETAVQFARELKTRLSPESYGQVKQGMWSRLTEAPEGMIPWESQRISQNLHGFLKSELAKTIYTPNERMLMKTIADAHSQQIPVAGSTNPSGTAPMLSKIARGAQSQLLGLFGFSHGGLPGAGVALAAGKALSWSADRRAAKEATKLFLGEQPVPAGNAARRAQLERLTSTGIRGSQSATSR